MVLVGDSRLVKPCGRVILPQTGALMNYADGWISFPQKGAQPELQQYTEPITFKRDKASLFGANHLVVMVADKECQLEKGEQKFIDITPMQKNCEGWSTVQMDW